MKYILKLILFNISSFSFITERNILLPHSSHCGLISFLCCQTQEFLLLSKIIKDLKTGLFHYNSKFHEIFWRNIFCHFPIILLMHYNLFNIYSKWHCISQRKKILSMYAHDYFIMNTYFNFSLKILLLILFTETH